MNNGKEVISKLEDEVRNLKAKGITPGIVLLGSYAYYLLKQYIQDMSQPVNRYEEILQIEIEDCVLEIALLRSTLNGGRHTQDSTTIKVFGA